MRPRADVARLLGATGPGAWALAALYAVTYIVIAFWVDPGYTASPLGFAGLAAMIGAAVALVLPQLSPFPHLAAAGVLVACAFTMTAGLWQLGPDDWRGWVTWYIGAASYPAFTLVLRDRFWWGVSILVAQTAVATHWAVVTLGDPFAGLGLVYAQIILFGAGSFFAVWLRRTADRIAAFHETRLRRESAEEARSAAEEERARELRVIRARANDALQRIAAGTVDDHERADHVLLEAELRDRIRGRGLAAPPLETAVRAARRRGAVVALLDDLRGDPPPADWLAEAVEWAAARVDNAGEGEVTVRLTRTAAEPVVTFATAEGGVETFGRRVGWARQGG